MGGIILGLGLGFAGLGFAAPFIAIGAGAMIIAGVAVAAIGVGLKALAEIDFKKLGNINKKGSGPFAWSGETTKGFLGMFKRKKTNFEVAVESIVDGLLPFIGREDYKKWRQENKKLSLWKEQHDFLIISDRLKRVIQSIEINT
mgnify:CR=1 FL=1